MPNVELKKPEFNWLPVQYYDGLRPNRLNSAQRLAQAVLENAILMFRGHALCANGYLVSDNCKRKKVLEARRWLLGVDEDKETYHRAFSSSWVFDALGINADYFRENLDNIIYELHIRRKPTDKQLGVKVNR